MCETYETKHLTMWFVKCLLITLFIIFTESQKFRYDYTYSPEVDGWFKLHPIPAVWQEGRLRCKLEGAVIASPNDIEMYSALRRLVKAQLPEGSGVYTGVHATFSKGDFFSVEGVPLTKMPVDWSGQPDNLKDNENCIWFKGDGKIQDVRCNGGFPFVCFKKRTDDMAINECGTVDKEYTLEPRTGSCYKFHRVARNWSRAFMTCASEGGYLAIANSQEEATILKDIFNNNPKSSILQVNNNLMREIMHMGFHDWDERGDWTTIHGVSIRETGFNVWQQGQPDNATTGEFCGSMFRSGLLNDVWCNEIGPFICEMIPNSLQEGK